MHPEAVEGLLDKDVFAEGGFAAKAFAPVGAGEEARWQRHRVDEGKGRVMRGEEEQFLPEALLNLPEVGRLPGEGGSMYLAKGGKLSVVMSAEEEVYVLIGVDAEVLADDLDGEYLGIGELGERSSLTNAASLELVIDEAEDGDDEGAKIHE